MKCFICEQKEAKERFGAYCSQKCRDKALKKLETQKKQAEKRKIESELRKFEEWSKSGYRTY